MQSAVYDYKEPVGVQIATNLFDFIFNKQDRSDTVSLHTYKITTHPKMERSNLLKNREILICSIPVQSSTLVKHVDSALEPSEILSIKFITTPVLFENKINEKVYRISITHHRESNTSGVFEKIYIRLFVPSLNLSFSLKCET